MNSRALGFVEIVSPSQADILEDEPEYPKIELVRYDQFVFRLLKAESYKDMLHHVKGGCCEEAGELSSAIKRHLTYGKSLDSVVDPVTGQTLRENIIEELGDLRWFMQGVMNILDIDEQTVLQANADKLSERYRGLVYTDEAANERADKTGQSSN